MGSRDVAVDSSFQELDTLLLMLYHINPALQIDRNMVMDPEINFGTWAFSGPIFSNMRLRLDYGGLGQTW